jgi:hypothetical protein
VAGILPGHGPAGERRRTIDGRQEKRMRRAGTA